MTRTIRRLPVAALSVLVLAGCAAKPLEVASITQISATNGSAGIDVHEQRRIAGDAGAPQFAGDQLMDVRTYTIQQGKGEVEVAGASCTLSAADFNATMTTPAKVRVPLYRNQSSTLAVSCEMPGYKKQMISVAPVDETRQQRLASGTNAGIVGVVMVAAIDAASDNTQNAWVYPPARLVLEPLAASQ